MNAPRFFALLSLLLGACRVVPEHEALEASLRVETEETHADAVGGRVFHAGRPLAHALAVIVVEGSGEAPSERVRRLAALDDADVLAIEPAFRAWLVAGMPTPAR